jgi:hypothetical protein
MSGSVQAKARRAASDGPPAEDLKGKAPRAINGPRAEKIRKLVNSRLTTLTAQRYSWWVHWRDLAEHILPRRYRWLVAEDIWRRGNQINQRILNSTGTLAARNCASGMMSGITSPSRPWFRLAPQNKALLQDDDVKQWVDEVADRMRRVMSSSNYYLAKAVQYLDLVVFGTAPMLIYEDYDTVIRCFNPQAGEYYCAVGPNGNVDTLYRKYTMSVSAAVREFGIDNVCESTRSMYLRGDGANLDNEVVICHAIEPNPEYIAEGAPLGESGLPRRFRYREVYWEEKSPNDYVLRMNGFEDSPFSAPRWDVSGNDAYGRSPGMDALGDVKQLQLEEKRKAQAIDKMVNPPMIADPSLKNEPASLLPGAVTYVPSLNGGIGFKPAFTINPPVAELKDDIAKVEGRIKDVFFNDLFLMISQLDTVRTATEIDARREEKLVLLGPVLERNESESLDPDIKRIYNIMARAGLFPLAPEALQGEAMKVEYVSMLAEAQRASATTGLERVWAFAGNLAAGVGPDVLDNLDPDETINIYADWLRVPAKVLRNKRAKEAIRQQRTEAAQKQQAMQDAAAGAQGAKVLSETEVGGGQNALSLMLNGGAP